MSRKSYTLQLYSLGCAYSLSDKVESADLEQTILDGLQFYWSSNDLFFMLYSLLVHRIGHLVHIERLILLAKQKDLTQDELTLLLCLSQKMVNAGYKNFEVVIKKLHKRNLKFETLPDSETDSFLLERWGIDSDFKKYGAEVRTLPLEPSKKFFTLEKIFKMNMWLSLRALIGTNNRADIIYVKTSKLVPTANQAAKFLGCSIDAAYRYWRAASAIEGVKLQIKSRTRSQLDQ